MALFGRNKEAESQKTEKKKEKNKEKKTEKKTGYVYDGLHKEGRIHARVIDANTGLRVFEGVYAVRIRSKKFNALIMSDYLPALGQVEGSVMIVDRDGEHVFEGVNGYYKHQHNEFTLLIDTYEKQKETKE